VRVLEEDPKAGTDEGRAMLQVVHDVAPEAQLAFATAEGDELASAARAQRNAWLDQRLQALSAEDRVVIARATVLLSRIADS